MQDAPTLERRGELFDLRQEILEDDALIVGQELAADVDTPHGASGSVAS